MTDQVFRASYDAYVNEDHPATNYGDASKIRMSAQASNQKFGYVHFPLGIPDEATVVDATLTVYLFAAWTGANTMTVKRITQKWGEKNIVWTGRPDVTATSSAAAAVTGGSSREALSADVTALVQAWVQGKANYGWRLEVAGSADRDLYSSEYADPSMRPMLTVSWVMPPDPPRNLRPDGGRAVSSANPLLLWEAETPSFIQVQVDNNSDFSSTLADTGYIAATENEYDTVAETSLTNNTTYYWRVRIKDSNGVASDWSDTAEFEYRTLGTVAVTAPTATTNTTRPVITHTLTGRTQAYSAYYLYEDDVVVYSRPKLASTATSFTLPGTYVRDTTASYEIVVRLWDTFDREAVGTANDYSEDGQIFTLADDAATGPVLTLTAVQTDGHVVLEWTRAAAPDTFSIRVNGVIVEDDIDPDDVFVSGTTYRKSFYRATPWAGLVSTYEVLAVTSAVQSAANPSATLEFQPRGIWLVDEDSGTECQITGRETVSSVLGETGATYFPLARRDPVRIVDSIRGWEGDVQGVLIGWGSTTISEARDAFEYIKGHPGNAVRLVYSRRNIPIIVGEASCEMTDDGEEVYRVGLAYFQRDEFSVDLEG